MKTNVYIIILCVVVGGLTVCKNGDYARKSQKEEFVKIQRDSISLMQYENILEGIQASTHVLDSLTQIQKSVDSVNLKTQGHILKQMDLLIHINRQILEQNKNQRCSISSTIHTVE